MESAGTFSKRETRCEIRARRDFKSTKALSKSNSPRTKMVKRREYPIVQAPPPPAQKEIDLGQQVAEKPHQGHTNGDFFSTRDGIFSSGENQYNPQLLNSLFSLNGEGKKEK